MPFTPEYSLPTLRYYYSQFRPRIWTAYGFRDSFNLGAQWWDTDELGIDQGPILLMIENHRTQRLWQRFMNNAQIQRGLQRAGFVPLPVTVSSEQVAPTWARSAAVSKGPAAGATMHQSLANSRGCGWSFAHSRAPQNENARPKARIAPLKPESTKCATNGHLHLQRPPRQLDAASSD